MPWFMTPFGPQFVVEPGTVREFRRRDYAELTTKQAADYFAGVSKPDPVSFVTEAELRAALNAQKTAVVLPAPGSYTYNPDDTVKTEPNGKTYTYNPDGTVKTETLDGVTRTYSYNADGTVASVA